MSEDSYLRAKEKYRIYLKDHEFDRLIQLFEGFGPGTYWFQHGGPGGRHIRYFDAWLTPEELTSLKLSIPDAWYVAS